MQSQWIQKRPSRRNPRCRQQHRPDRIPVERSPVLDRGHRFEDSSLSNSLHFTVLEEAAQMTTFTHILAYGVRRLITKLVDVSDGPRSDIKPLLLTTREKGRRDRAMNLCIDEDNIMINAVVDVTVSERVSVSDAGIFCLGERSHGGLELGDVRVPRSVKTLRCANHWFKLVFKLVCVGGQCPMYNGQWPMSCGEQHHNDICVLK